MKKVSIFLGPWVVFLLASCQEAKRSSQLSTTSLDEYAIVYNVLVNDSTDNYEVFTMNMDGSQQKNITNLKGVEWSYYSFKDKVYFISDKDSCQRCAYYLYETNSKGDHPQKVSTIPLADSWMSGRNEGNELIIKPKSDSVFYIIDLEGKVLSKLNTDFPYSGDPLFVNGGKQVVFRGGQTKSKLIKGFNEELYIIDEDGKNKKQLTQYPTMDTTAGKFGYKAGTPKLHPTENYITYQSKQNGKYSLYAVSLDGQKHWKLTENKENEGWHDWSPDGKWLAIELFDNDQTQFHIGLMNWETQELKILTDSTYQYQQSPSFVIKSKEATMHNR